MSLNFLFIGNCSACGASGVTIQTCPLNPKAKNPNHNDHNPEPLPKYLATGAAAAASKTIYKCEKGCGFKSTYSDVDIHELTCNGKVHIKKKKTTRNTPVLRGGGGKSGGGGGGGGGRGVFNSIYKFIWGRGDPFVLYIREQMKLQTPNGAPFEFQPMGDTINEKKMKNMLDNLTKHLQIGSIDHNDNLIDEGGYGKIYHTTNNNNRIVKVLTFTDNLHVFILETLIQLYISFKQPTLTPLIHAVSLENSSFYIEMDSLDGDLDHLLTNDDDDDMLIYFIQKVAIMLQNLQSVFNNHFIHGDLHTKNVMYKSTSKKGLEFFLIDFGFSCIHFNSLFFNTLFLNDWKEDTIKTCRNRSHDLRFFIQDILKLKKINNPLLNRYNDYLKEDRYSDLDHFDKMKWYYAVEIDDPRFYPENILQDIKNFWEEDS